MRYKATVQADHRQAPDNVEPFAGSSRSVGERLRNAREDLGLELRQVSEILRIRYAHLRALEEGDSAALPGLTYAVGFVRTYADYLSLDSREMVERYKEEMSGVPRSTQLVFPTPKPEGKIPGAALVLVSLLLVGLAYGGWYAFNEYGDELDSLIMREAPPTQVAEQVEPPAPAVELPSEPVGGRAPTAGAPVSGATDSAPAPAAEPPAAESAATPAPADSLEERSLERIEECFPA
ncbi:MAG: helix-turn-helix domain-containing protein, partial [Tistlia sp.]|uniref:helix-turn-helix domain-containing protein n=1 Tax=Tistlia sp. TaxID=3057121 RepID=UPI0034A21FA3